MDGVSDPVGDVDQNERQTVSLLGARLRRIRRMSGLTLQQVAARAEVSHSFLSMLERGQVDVSLSRLGRIAAVCGISLSDLMVDEEVDSIPFAIRLDDLRLINEEAGIDRRILPHGSEFGLQCLHILIAPMTERSVLHVHTGRVLIWVIEGSLTLLHGQHTYDIPAGSGVTYSGRVPHRMMNRSSRRVELFAVNTPSYW
jgi:transcriptional regulator with XRE-family HTH domain